MKEKLIIKNFGPIKDVELELGRFNVLIGEQATGKSTVAKVLAVCRYFSYIINNEEYLNSFNLGLEAWGLNESIKEDSYIYYECNHYSLTGLIKKGSFTGLKRKEHESLAPVFTIEIKPFSNEFTNLLGELEKLRPQGNEPAINIGFSTVKGWRIPNSFFKNDVAAVMDNPFYLPTERGLQSIFSLGKSSIQNISDSLFNQFAKLDQIARLFKNDTIIEPLEITYKNVDGRGFIKSEKHDFLSLFNAASGYQSTIPIVLLIKYYSEIRRRNKTFIIEEPELNLFPVAQNKLMQYLADKIINYENTILLTTHSPYILSSVNNLIYAYKIGQNNKEAVCEIIPERYWLNPADLSAYRLLSDGTAKNIVDEDLEEIAVEELDEAGKQMNADYDKILDIKFRVNEMS